MLLLNLPADAETKIVPFRNTVGREHFDASEFNLTQMGEGWALIAILELQQVVVQRDWNNDSRKDKAEVVTVKGALLCRTKNAAEADLARREQILAEVTRANQYRFDNLEHGTKRSIAESEKAVVRAEAARDGANAARAAVQAQLDAAEVAKRKMEEDLAKIRKAVGERVWKETVG